MNAPVHPLRGPDRGPRKFRSPEVWEEVRERYLAGVPAPQLALEYGVGLANLRRRSMEEGWTRKHQHRLQAAPNVRWMTRRPGEPVLSAHERALADFRETWPEVWDRLHELASEFAEAALRDTPEEAWPMGEWAYRWRAETFGPECAEADRQQAEARAAVEQQD